MNAREWAASGQLDPSISAPMLRYRRHKGWTDAEALLTPKDADKDDTVVAFVKKHVPNYKAPHEILAELSMRSRVEAHV